MLNSVGVVKRLAFERSVEVEVACSVEQVYTLWENLENVPRWMPMVQQVKCLPGDEELWHWTFGSGLIPAKYTLFGLLNLVLETPQSGIPAMTSSAPNKSAPGASTIPLNETSKKRIWGFTPGAETLNGRLAMLGFVSALLLEFFSGQGILHFLNLL